MCRWQWKWKIKIFFFVRVNRIFMKYLVFGSMFLYLLQQPHYRKQMQLATFGHENHGLHMSDALILQFTQKHRVPWLRSEPSEFLSAKKNFRIQIFSCLTHGKSIFFLLQLSLERRTNDAWKMRQYSSLLCAWKPPQLPGEWEKKESEKWFILSWLRCVQLFHRWNGTMWMHHRVSTLSHFIHSFCPYCCVCHTTWLQEKHYIHFDDEQIERKHHQQRKKEKKKWTEHTHTHRHKRR